MKKQVMAFSGPSNSGKTTLINKLIKHFSAQNLKVFVLKHDPSDKACFDTKGKDSFSFFENKAEVFVLSPTRTTFFSHEPRSVEECLRLAGDFDLFLIEGLKTLPYPRIGVFKDKLDESYFSVCKAIASYEKPKNNTLTWLDLDDIKGIASFILQNAFQFKG
ncbi:molybdopterin-guanine dinucleotide biosynthesis protein B [Campylobacter sp. MIT 12-5580]|uniref:molybdopterin-guanine dinucleotide biosynthesis protein B n=1 Tax=Campylobacter sp. MIT 12-5580 TaxID=2040651 RepID=UPI0010F644CA|nr:molybdopterin-guanine dinucleotide biosynthesis protein B [Campylobacter sp. MIT 12-5580]TKX29070.1 molybdopterin-guanine dinucleotide biosynthesis protein B [Campylobacter sp. MIT 12-5580]